MKEALTQFGVGGEHPLRLMLNINLKHQPRHYLKKLNLETSIPIF